MNHTEALVQAALELYRFGPENAGLSLFLGGGPTETKSPDLSASVSAQMAGEHGLAREPEERSAIELHVFIDHDGEEFSCRVEKVVGVGFLDTIPDETIVLSSFKVATLDEIGPELVDKLEEAAGDTELYLGKVFYRKDQLTKAKFAKDREKTENPGRLNRWLGYADKELRTFVYETFQTALSWGPDNGNPQSISVWIYPELEEDSTGAIYVNLTQEEGGFGVSLEDRAGYPFVKKIKVVKSFDEIAALVAGHLSKKHAFKWVGARSYFAYTHRG